MAERGFITVAARSNAYAEMAVDLALSLRVWHTDPICVVADQDTARHITAHYPGVFDDIAFLPARYDVGRTRKFALAELTPYRRNFFIDADTLVLAPVEQLWRDADGHPFQMMGTHRTRETTETHHGFAVTDLIDEFKLERYFDNHSGAFLFERDLARPFLDECFAVYVNELFTLQRRLGGLVGDELAFGVVGGRRGMASMRDPYPVLWPNELAALRPGEPTKALCHFIGAPSRATLDWLMDGVRQRRLARGLPLASESAWRTKAARSDRFTRWGRLLSRVRDALRGARRADAAP